MESPAIGRIFIYPIKSLDGVAVNQSAILAGGALQHDREFALFDEHGKWINGKRDARIHAIRARYNLADFTVTLAVNGESDRATFLLTADRAQMERWFSDFFGFRISVRRDCETGFPDDTDSPGPTITTSATLRAVGSWFDITDYDAVRRRFRPNIEFDSGAPFWEDRLFGAAEEIVRFRIGEITVEGINPCQRCPVPSRDPETGVVIDEFQRLFAANRAKTLPAWAAPSRFDHFYRLSVNTRIPASETGKIMKAGDRFSPCS